MSGYAMTFDEFQATLRLDAIPPELSGIQAALWLDACGDWEGAHRAAQAQPDPDGAWLHAYLHRKEGDLANARYWYRRAGRDEPECTLDEEWRTLAVAFTESR